MLPVVLLNIFTCQTLFSSGYLSLTHGGEWELDSVARQIQDLLATGHYDSVGNAVIYSPNWEKMEI